jgi:dolichol kinase
MFVEKPRENLKLKARTESTETGNGTETDSAPKPPDPSLPVMQMNTSPSPVSPESQSLKQKSDLHLARKIWHCIGICLMAGLYNFAGPYWSWVLLLVFAAMILPFDYLRQKRPGLNKVALKIFAPVMRKHESHSLSGLSYLMLGCMFLLFFDRHIVTLTLLFLAFGDPLASFCGIRFGKDRIFGNKTLQGTLGAFVVCTLIGGLYYYFNNLMTERLLIVAPLSGLIGAVAELLPIGKLDDNLTFPIIGSSLLWLLFQIYGGFAI